MILNQIQLNDELAAEFRESVQSSQPVSGLTHNFYNYPARFSPLFARAAIKAFTEPGDLILDPFMGGGTTLVEARVLSRRVVGADINELAVFVARVKTTPLSEGDISSIQIWTESLDEVLNLHNPPVRAEKWIERGYQRNINGRKTWPIRKTLELALAQIERLQSTRQQEFARCVLLRTGQWALHCRRDIPSAQAFRDQLIVNFLEMSEAAREFAIQVQEADRFFQYEYLGSSRTSCLHRSAIGIQHEPQLFDSSSPKLILTSPPYPGVHVVYHRWQVEGRRETPAPYWIANSLDGHGETFYSLGSRKQEGLDDYYAEALRSFESLAQVSDRETILIQMVGFSDPSWQFPRYLEMMERAGFEEITLPMVANSPTERLWRRVPNRRWYASQKGAIPSSSEVVLFHRLAQ